jgi:hypothetical protein
MPDGHILYTVDHPDGDPANGLWSVSPDGATPRQIVNAESAELGSAVLVAAAGGTALLLGSYAGFQIVDLASGTMTPLRAADPPNRGHAAAFSPDGSAVLLESGINLALRDLSSGTTTQLGTLDHIFASGYGQSGLAWSSTGFAFGPIEAGWGQLLHLTAP